MKQWTRLFLPKTRRTRRVWVVGIVVSAGVLALIHLPPFLEAPAREIVFALFGPVCHQIPARSPSIDGVSFAVCHRCYGIYWGVLGAFLAFFVLYRATPTLRKHPLLFLIAALTPLGIDWGLNFLGWWHNTPPSRMLTGGMFGVALGFLLAKGILEQAARNDSTTS